MTTALEREIKATGLRRAALYYDMSAAVNRLQVTKNVRELHSLTTDQLVMLLVQGRLGPDAPLWSYTETRLGRPLPKD